ncbi:MAG: hypothetical protein WC967_12055 [Balneolaceae bacterium]
MILSIISIISGCVTSEGGDLSLLQAKVDDMETNISAIAKENHVNAEKIDETRDQIAEMRLQISTATEQTSEIGEIKSQVEKVRDSVLQIGNQTNTSDTGGVFVFATVSVLGLLFFAMIALLAYFVIKSGFLEKSLTNVTGAIKTIDDDDIKKTIKLAVKRKFGENQSLDDLDKWLIKTDNYAKTKKSLKKSEQGDDNNNGTL